ncbi:MAG TPA: FKBP-type peptidyl-prolyl cis-trans isomerase [Microthrixaceae bacterium]|nr:FKBP-type peptidyl-prolyl cis-trans isomerase [Microthrixaceae bacterium]RTL05161.1 MAG: FKBP-type peptidyl-prolyl cis-trans isomerase [Acidimicrobiia bacterium]MCO5307538.1 FKBP-type peptidyl-prolyl cis-trans isomerase [Microthrixaceae bacterium]HMU78741.1 FKBP-type peptidyl-prolyl cis-trans isomerase [Microthrixaceae bacterium]HMV73950.1 FKBP-type peptidyl-prolyl cis-trans isomerase [Microthrixaceae bacterium]
MSQVRDEIEARGKPQLGAVDAVTELVVTDEVEGQGDEVTAGATVTAHYVGVSASTGAQFDASWDRGAPISFPLDGVIRGWSEGLLGMKVGGRRNLVIPGDMAYGANPPPGAGIAPNETLVFTVDLVDVSWR